MDERSKRQMEFGDVPPGELVPRRNTHRAGFAVQAAFEAQRPHAAADMARIGFEDGDAMSPALELVGGGESGQSRAYDDDVQPAFGVRCGRQRGECGIGRRRAGKRAQAPKKLTARGKAWTPVGRHQSSSGSRKRVPRGNSSPNV
jgi:hypothetical protein